jgi:hypothetical protein
LEEGLRVFRSEVPIVKIVVVTNANVERLHTLRLLNDCEITHYVVTHTETMRRKIENLRMKYSKVLVSGARTLVGQRNWILDELIDVDEWFIGMDDNIRAFTAVQPKYYASERLDTADTSIPWREVYNAELDPLRWLRLLAEDTRTAEREGVPLVGVATMENPYFRAKKYSNFRFVKTKVFAMKNVGNLRFKHEMCHDSYISVACVARYGKVLVNSFLHHKSKMYEVGGLGNRADRERKGLLKQMDDICREFPGLADVGRGENTALRFKVVTERSSERWRRSNGYLS